MNEGETLGVNRILAVDAREMNPRRRVPGDGAAGPVLRVVVGGGGRGMGEGRGVGGLSSRAS